MIAAPAMTPGQRKAGIVVGISVAIALLLALFVRGSTAGGLGDRLRHSLTPLETLATMIADRSPGDRPEGALASLKHKKQAVLADHVPAPAAPPSPLAAALMAPPEVIAPPLAGPLYGLLGGPGALVPSAETVALIPPVGGGGGIIVPGAGPGAGGGSGGGGGGGGAGTPPITTPTITPTDTTSAVPEPGSWAMMLVGFGLLGAAIRRQRVTVKASVGT